jgi:hypothetical protein
MDNSMMKSSSTDAMPMKTNMYEYYTCITHPQIKKDSLGKCLICGIDLIKKQGELSHSKNQMGMDSIWK